MNRRHVLLLAAGVPAMMAAGRPQPQPLSTEELEKLLEKRENLFFLDVRDPDEIKRLGTSRAR